MSGYTDDLLNPRICNSLTCAACGKDILGAYATIGGNWVPYIAVHAYHMECVPKIPRRDPKWVLTPLGHLMYDGSPVADLRYKASTSDLREFILAALNAAEEKR